MADTDIADAERWRKLKRLIGSPRNASDSRVSLYWDDATMTQHITLNKLHYGVENDNFDSIIDSIPDVCPHCYERNCQCETLSND